MNTFDLVLFDLDGTLADTGQDMASALNLLLKKHSKPPIPYDKIRPYVSGGTPALIGIGFGLTPENPEFKHLREMFLEIYEDNLCVKTVLFPGMSDILAECSKREIPWGVVTNKPEYLTRPLLEQMGIAEQAACIVGGDTLEVRKPNPEPVLHACRIAERNAKSSVFVGDAERDVRAGRSAGLSTIVAGYGYIPPDENPATWGANWIADSVEQVADFLWNTNALN